MLWNISRPQTEAVAAKLVSSITATNPSSECCPANADRLALVFAAPILFDTVVGNPVIQIGYGRDNAFRCIATLTPFRPHAVLRLEEYGQLILQQLFALDTLSLGYRLTTHEIVRVAEVPRV